MGPGPITVAQVAQLYPYDNTLRAVRISGKQLRDYLEFSSRYYRTSSFGNGAARKPIPRFQATTSTSSPAWTTRSICRGQSARGSRVSTTRESRFATTDSFTMALNNYRQTGGGGFAMLSGAPVVYDKQQEIRQLLIDEVKRRGEIRQADYFVPNWSLVRGSAAGRRCGRRRSLSQPSRLGRVFSASSAPTIFMVRWSRRPDPSGVRRGGAAYVGAAIDRARRECAPSCETLLLDGGDMFQGTPASNLSYGRPVVDYYNRWATPRPRSATTSSTGASTRLRARMRQAKFGILGANVRYTDGRDVAMDQQRHDRHPRTDEDRNHRSVDSIDADYYACWQCRRASLRRSSADRGQHRPRAPATGRRFSGRDRARRRQLRQGSRRHVQRRDLRFRQEAHHESRCHRQRSHPQPPQHRRERNSDRAGEIDAAGRSTCSICRSAPPRRWDRDRMSASWPPTRSSLWRRSTRSFSVPSRASRRL